MTTGQRRRSVGLCRDCDSEPVDGKSMCAAHLDRNRHYQAKHRGMPTVCPDCGKKTSGQGKRCRGCSRKVAVKSWFGRGFKVPMVRCSVCRVSVPDKASERERHGRGCPGAQWGAV